MLPCQRMSQGTQCSGIENWCPCVEVRKIHPSDQTWGQSWVSSSNTGLVSPNLDALWGCQVPAASIKLSSLAAGRAPDPLCFTLVSQVHRFNISGLVRRVSGGAAGMEKRLIRELLSVCGGVWLWSGTATAAVALGLIPVSTRTSFRFQGSSGRLSPGNSYVLTDLRFCTSSSLPTQTAVDQAGTLHLFPGEAANAVKQLWESSWCPWDGAFRVMPSGWCPESDALLIL